MVDPALDTVEATTSSQVEKWPEWGLPWEPFKIGVSAFYAICVKQALDATIRVFNDHPVQASVVLDHPWEVSRHLTVILLLGTYIMWLGMHYFYNLMNYFRVPLGDDTARLLGFINLTLTLSCFYAMGSTIAYPRQSQLILAIAILAIDLQLPARVLSKVLTLDERSWWTFKSVVQILFASLVLASGTLSSSPTEVALASIYLFLVLDLLVPVLFSNVMSRAGKIAWAVKSVLQLVGITLLSMVAPSNNETDRLTWAAVAFCLVLSMTLLIPFEFRREWRRGFKGWPLQSGLFAPPAEGEQEMGLDLEATASRIDDWAARRLQTPGAAALDAIGLRATHVNLLGLAGCFAAALFVAQGRYLTGGLIFLVASGLDALDGTLARRQGTATSFKLGGWLDSFAGAVGEASIFVGLWFASESATFLRLVGLAAVSTLLVSLVKAVAGEYGIRPDWREIRVFGRGLRIPIVAVGLMVAGVSDGGLSTVMGTALSVLLVYNLFMMAYRTQKIVRQGIR